MPVPDEELFPDETAAGMQIVHVEQRVAGSLRMVPQTIMPDPDEPERWVIARRDPDTGQLAPQRRRGITQVVEPGEEGVWRIAEDPERVEVKMDISASDDGEQVDQLLSATTEEKPEISGRTPPGGRVIESYDFKHPARVNKDQLRTLENLHDNFARLLTSTFSGAMRAVVDVDTAFVDQTTYREFIASLSNPSCSYQFTLGPTGGQAIIDFATPLTFAFVDRIFGGKGSSEGVDARQMSQIEMGVIAKIVKRVIEDLEATWEPILRVEISDIELETNPEFMQITAASEIVILLAFEVNSTNASGLVSLAYPFFTLSSILPRLGQQTYVRQSRLPQEQRRSLNRAALGPVRAPVVVEMGRTKLRLAEVEGVQEGDVICMKSRRTDPCVVLVGGRPKYYARPFATATGEMALQVAGMVPTELQESYLP